MATGTEILGTRQLDILGVATSEVASFGNTSSNTLIRIYDNDTPDHNYYLFGLCNSAFTITRGDAPTNTQVNIGTYNAPPAGVNLQVAGPMVASGIGIGVQSPSADVHVNNGTILCSDGYSSNVSRVYPPDPMTSNITTFTTSRYGNGTYTLTSSYGEVRSLSNTFNGTVTPISEFSQSNFWQPANFAFSSNDYFPLTSQSQLLSFNVDGSTQSIRAVDLNITLPLDITPTYFSVFAYQNIYEHALYSSKDGSRWTRVFYQNSTANVNSNNWFTYTIPQTPDSARYYKYLLMRMFTPSHDAPRISEFSLVGYETYPTAFFSATSDGIGVGTNTPLAKLHVENGGLLTTTQNSYISPSRQYPPVNNFTSSPFTVSGQSYGNGVYQVSSISGLSGSTTTQPWRALDGSLTTHFTTNRTFVNNGGYNGTVYPDVFYLLVDGVNTMFAGPDFELELPTAIVVDDMQLYFSSQVPKTHYLLGSMNRVEWVTLLYETDITYIQSGTYSSVRFSPIDTTCKYIKYIVTAVTDNVAATVFQLTDFKIFGYETVTEVRPTLFASNNQVGIGTTTPSSTLDVIGDARVSGSLLIGGGIVDTSGKYSYRSFSMSNAVNDTKIIQTNSSVPSSRVLFAFSVKAGSYYVFATLPYVNLSSLVPIDTINWASIGLFSTSVASYSDASTPLYTTSLNAIGGRVTDYDSANFNTFISPVIDQEYVIAIIGRGHLLQFGGAGYGMPTPTLHVVPATGLGTEYNIAVRQPLQLAPIRNATLSTSGQRNYTVSAPGIYAGISVSNVDVFVRGTKASNILLTQNYDGTNTTFQVTLESAPATNTNVEISVWPQVFTSNYYYSPGYMYQSINNYSAPFQNVQSGGVRLPNNLIVDGNIYLSGTVTSNYNTALFTSSGIQWDGTDIASNVLGTCNIANGAITTSKIADAAITAAKIANQQVTSAKIADGAIQSVNIADGAITSSKLNLMSTTSNIGVGVTSPRAQFHVNGTIMTNRAFTINNANATQYIGYDFSLSNIGSMVSYTTSNVLFKVQPFIRIDAVDVATANNQTVTAWGPFESVSSAPVVYTTGGYLGGSYVLFNEQTMRALMLDETFISVNMSAKYGMTIVAFVRFDQETVRDSDVICILKNGVTNAIIIQRSTSDSTALVIRTKPTPLTTSTGTVTIPNIVTTNEWALYTFTYDPQNFLTVHKDGIPVYHGSINSTPTNILFNGAYNFTYYLCQNEAGNNFGRISYGCFHVYDKFLDNNELAYLRNYILQGYATQRSNYTRQLQFDPTASSIYANSAINFNALPSEYVWWIDVYTPQSFFSSLPTSTVFDLAGKRISMSTTTNEYITSPLTIPSHACTFGLSGITYVIQFVRTRPNVSVSYLKIITTSNHTIELNDLQVNVYQGSTLLYTTTPTTTILTNGLYTIVLSMYRTRLTLWVNGTIVVDDATVFNTFRLPDTTSVSTQIAFGGHVYMAAFYNKVFTEQEVTNFVRILAAPKQPYTTRLTCGSSTAKPIFSISEENGEAVIPSLNIGEVTKDLLAQVLCDGHVYDTSTTTALQSLQFTGIQQYNPAAQSIVLANAIGNTTSAQHYITYAVASSSVFGVSNKTMSFWMYPYAIPATGITSSLLTLNSSTSTIPVFSVYVSNASLGCQLLNTANNRITLPTNVTTRSNVWYHVATTFQNNATYLYVNGQIAACNLSVQLSTCNVTGLLVGASNASFPFNGELRDIRIYSRPLQLYEIQNTITPRISTALNVANTFTVTPSTVKTILPMNISDNTTIQSVVTNANSKTNELQINMREFRLVDYTYRNSNVDLYGSGQISSLNPFVSQSDEGSVQFVPPQSYITQEYTGTPFVQTTGVTFEAWVYYSSYENASVTVSGELVPTLAVVHDSTAAAPITWAFGLSSIGYITFTYRPVATNVRISGTTTLIQLNRWYHIAFSLTSGGVLRAFVNGVQEFTQTGITLGTAYNRLTIGYYGTTTPSVVSNNMFGYISNVRYTQSALYTTTSFTVPTVPYSASASTLLLLRVVRSTQTPVKITSAGNMNIAGGVYSDNMSFMRNKIINGHMIIDQINNGSTVTNSATNTATFPLIDKWKIDTNRTGGVFTSAVTTLATTDTPFASGFTKSLRITITTAVTGTNVYFRPFQFIEEQMLMDSGWSGFGRGYYFTLTFWVRAKEAGVYNVVLTNGSQSYIDTFRCTTADAWQFVTMQIPPPNIDVGTTWLSTSVNTQRSRLIIGSANVSGAGVTGIPGWNNSGSSLAIASTLQWYATATNYIEFTGVQLERGQVATPFEFRSFATELSLCRRYLETSGNVISVFPGCETSATLTTAVNVGATVPFSTTKRSFSNYAVTLFDAINTSNRISLKIPTRSASNNFAASVTDRSYNSFYVGFGNAATYNTIFGSAHTTFSRANMVFRWIVDDDVSGV